MSFHRDLGLALLPITLALSSCARAPKTTAFPSVHTAKIESRAFQPTIETISVLESTSNVAIKPESSGRVVRIVAREGQRVNAGDTILVLDDVQQRAALNAAEAQAHTDRLNAERYQFLYSQGATSAKERDRYRTQAIASRDQAVAAAATLGYKTVRSPIDGVIGSLDSVKLGDYVTTGQAITGIVNNATLWTLMQIPASQAGAVRAGQTVTVTSQTDPPIRGRGSVSFIAPYFGTPGTTNAPNTVMVKATFPNLTGTLKTGQYVKSEIITSERERLAVPVQAVFMQAEQPFVFVVVPLKNVLNQIKASTTIPETTKQKLERLPSTTPIAVERAVDLGPLQNNVYAVNSGLKAGDVVVSSNTALLRNGTPVRPAQGGN